MHTSTNKPSDLIPTHLPSAPLSALTASLIDWSGPYKPLRGRPR